MINKILRYHWRAIIWIIIILIGCLMPIPNSDSLHSAFLKIPHLDKIIHFLLYSVFTLFLMSGFSRQYGKALIITYIYSFAIAFTLGLSIEFIQDTVGRSCDFYDMLANTAGIVVSLLLFNPIKWILRNIL